MTTGREKQHDDSAARVTFEICLSDNRLEVCQLRCVTFVVSGLNGVRVKNLEHRGFETMLQCVRFSEAEPQTELNCARRVHL